MNTPTDFAHAAAVERILARAHGVAFPQVGVGNDPHLGDVPPWGHGTAPGTGSQVCGPCARSPGGAEGQRPFSKRSDGPDGRPPARRSFLGQKRSGENGVG